MDVNSTVAINLVTAIKNAMRTGDGRYLETAEDEAVKLVSTAAGRELLRLIARARETTNYQHLSAALALVESA